LEMQVAIEILSKTSRTKHWNGTLQIKRSADFWYFQISRCCHRKKRNTKLGSLVMLQK
jgi:hypothetical protein